MSSVMRTPLYTEKSKDIEETVGGIFKRKERSEGASGRETRRRQGDGEGNRRLGQIEPREEEGDGECMTRRQDSFSSVRQQLGV